MFVLNRKINYPFDKYKVPAKNGQVKVRSSGKGWGFAQMKVCYNVMNIYEQFEYQTFECSLNTKSDDYNSAHVDYCCRFTQFCFYLNAYKNYFIMIKCI